MTKEQILEALYDLILEIRYEWNIEKKGEILNAIDGAMGMAGEMMRMLDKEGEE